MAPPGASQSPAKPGPPESSDQLFGWLFDAGAGGAAAAASGAGRRPQGLSLPGPDLAGASAASIPGLSGTPKRRQLAGVPEAALAGTSQARLSPGPGGTPSDQAGPHALTPERLGPAAPQRAVNAAAPVDWAPMPWGQKQPAHQPPPTSHELLAALWGAAEGEWGSAFQSQDEALQKRVQVQAQQCVSARTGRRQGRRSTRQRRTSL